MKELFDKELRNHIRDTFDHYDDLRADEAWIDFKQKKNRKRRGLLFWYSLPTGIAAALAFIWLFNIYDNPNLNSQDKLKLANKEVKNIDKQTIKRDDLNQNESTKELKPDIFTESDRLAKGSSNPKQLRQSTPNIVLVKINEPTLISSPTVYSVDREQTIETTSLTYAMVKPSQGVYQSPTIAMEKTNKSTINKLTTSDFLASEELSFNKLALTNQADSESDKKDEKKSSFNLSVDANTYYNFTASTVANQPHMGLGLLSEFRISKKLSLNTGIAFNTQSAQYNGNERNSRVNDLAMAANNGAFTAIPSSLETSARLVGFDIPLNLKYDIKIGKANIFITTGLSSYTLLNEKYTNELSVVNYSFTGLANKSTITNVDTNPDGSFNNFQFARTLNLSFGINYPISSKNSISFEPFLKYPLGGVGYQDLKIGSGGISFKLNFGK